MTKTKITAPEEGRCYALGCRNPLRGLRTLCLHCLRRVERARAKVDDPVSRATLRLLVSRYAETSSRESRGRALTPAAEIAKSVK